MTDPASAVPHRSGTVACALTLLDWFADHDLGRFGITGYDLPHLIAEFARTGAPFRADENHLTILARVSAA